MSAAEAIIVERPWSLRPYQVDALRGISSAWADADRTLLVLATGLGKTTVACEVALRRKLAGRGRCLMVAHRLELVEQLAARCEQGGLSVEIESGSSLASPLGLLSGASDVVVATIQTLRGRRLDRWGPRSFGTIVVDEAHHATAASYRTVLDHFDGAKVLGLTATPDRGDRIAVGHVFPSLAFAYGIREGIADGFLARLRVIAINTPSIDLSSVKVTKQEHGRDLSADQLAAQMRSEATLHELAGPIARERGDRQTLGFFPSVEVAHETARVLAGYMEHAHHVSSLDGTSDKQDRAEVLRRYHAGDVRALLNCALFTEGFDAPATACIAVCRPTQSRALYAQMIGRGTRLAPGKTDCLVLDFAPANARHSLVSPIDLFDGEDLPEDVREEMTRAAMTGEDVLRIVARGEEIAKKREAERQRDRERANKQAEVRYRKSERDPFAELGIETNIGDERGPRASTRQAEVLERMGIKEASALSRRQAGKLLDEVTRRRKEGLASMKQARILASKGLRTDLTFAEAGEAMTALASNGWKMTSEIAKRWGAE